MPWTVFQNGWFCSTYYYRTPQTIRQIRNCPQHRFIQGMSENNSLLKTSRLIKISQMASNQTGRVLQYHQSHSIEFIHQKTRNMQLDRKLAPWQKSLLDFKIPSKSPLADISGRFSTKLFPKQQSNLSKL